MMMMKENVKSCFDVLLFYYINRTRTAYRFAPWSTRLLYLCFIWNSDETFAPSPTIFFSVPDFFQITLFMIFSLS